MNRSRKRVFDKRSQSLADAISERWPQWAKRLRLVPKESTTGLGYLAFNIPRKNLRARHGIKVSTCKIGIFVEFDEDILHIDDYSDMETDLQNFTLRLVDGYLTDKLLVVSWKQNGDDSNVTITIGANDSLECPAEVKAGAACTVRSWSGKKDRDLIQF